METDSNSKGSTRTGGQDIMCGVVEGFYGRPWTTEQRRHLFKQLKKLGMNTYLYAPKDDLKHRAEWRILYTAEETDLLESLINSAKESNVTFVYALSPGIDIMYSNPKEVKAIQEKLMQVRSLGCTAFALLFDDIEPAMNAHDQKQFPSFVVAQVVVSNLIYEHLNCPSVFMFCPTEYCESRAVPTLEDSEYLTTLGSKLHPDIQVLWTGPRVVSRFLTIDHIQKVSKVLRRKPLIWDNLHANDYDPKRIFLGPFAGRPVGLKQEISGLLLNPNSKYEANFIPFSTLADWNEAEADAPKVEQDLNATLEAKPTDVAVHAVEKGKPTKLYHPLTSLKKAMEDWLEHYTQGTGPAIPPISQMETKTMANVVEPVVVSSAVPPPSIRTCEGNELLPITDLHDLPSPLYTSSPIGNATTVTVQAFPISESILGNPVNPAEQDMMISQTVNSLSTDYSTDPNTFTEPMDILSSVSAAALAAVASLSKQEDAHCSTVDMEVLPSEASDVAMEDSEEALNLQNIDGQKISLFVDIFYLPFEHGQKGVEFLREFQWLHENAQIVRSETDKCEKEESKEWMRRYHLFQLSVNQLNQLYKLVIESPNKSLVQEIFPYVWEAQGILSILSAVLGWMAQGNLLMAPLAESGSWWKSVEIDVEPWALGGGLLPDLQKLVVTSPQLADLFTIKFSIPLSLTCYSIRPVDSQELDKETAYRLLALEQEKSFVELMAKSRYEEMFFDKYFSLYFKYGRPAHHFVAQDSNNDAEDGPYKQFFSLSVGILDVLGVIEEEYHQTFLPQYKAKYIKIIEEEQENKDKAEHIQLLKTDIANSPLLHLPHELLLKYPSMVEIRWRNFTTEAVAVRRLLHVLAASLTLNGSKGFFTIISACNTEKIELLSRLGLHKLENELSEDYWKKSDYCVMGHAL